MACNVIISGINGKMGHVLERVCAEDPAITVVAGFDINPERRNCPVYVSPADFTDSADVVIDFSSPAALDPLLTFCINRNIPAVLATTGYTEKQAAQIELASQKVAIFRSANMSLGINVLLELVKQAAAVLGETYDIEITEKHHNRKVDAPSGTALMIADAAAESLNFKPEYIFDRHSIRQSRDKKEIGISSVRGGSIVGVHEVLFAGPDEMIEIRHTAMSRDIFANGALSAAKFIANVSKPGLYNMSDLMR